jgi:hypothetical protein
MTSKYEALSLHLQESPGPSLQMKFSEVEGVVGRPLPASARNHREWWSNNDSHTHARNGWLAAGWKTKNVDMAAQLLTFMRGPSAMRRLNGPVGPGGGLRSTQAIHEDDSEQRGVSQIEQRAGGAANLLEILRAVERYVDGEIVETELGRVIRRFWGRTT